MNYFIYTSQKRILFNGEFCMWQQVCGHDRALPRCHDKFFLAQRKKENGVAPGGHCENHKKRAHRMDYAIIRNNLYPP